MLCLLHVNVSSAPETNIIYTTNALTANFFFVLPYNHKNYYNYEHLNASLLTLCLPSMGRKCPYFFQNNIYRSFRSLQSVWRLWRKSSQFISCDVRRGHGNAAMPIWMALGNSMSNQQVPQHHPLRFIWN